MLYPFYYQSIACINILNISDSRDNKTVAYALTDFTNYIHILKIVTIFLWDIKLH